ncbi:thiamine pyrophosphate-binding protein [Bacillus sp. WMMC1349]|uniref:thiamine pyrophosphate-binding protein n=1 Tax=Bacillus sp. WMMC1349 TaxID=2736254 RepID=UPI0015554584|nr:thiamine pyrophosphate-binding protein [Bacillus sp. WMMC1349]NPC91652.1 thiamine pyrophosphate-binding protein [Bacillus sp. WMMC1349]
MFASIWDLYSYLLKKSNVQKVFAMVGEGEGLLEAAHLAKLDVYTAKDQRIAASMAMGYAQVSGEPVIYVASPGPGLVNGLTAVLESFSACVPIIIISSGTARTAVGTGAFQELNSVELMKSITKWQYRVEHEDQAEWALKRAMYLAVNGKPGPVYLEIPNDLEQQHYKKPSSLLQKEAVTICPHREQIRLTADALAKSKRPVFIAGGGCQHSPSFGPSLLSLAEKFQAAVFTTASGRGIVNEHHPHVFGNIGLYGLPEAKELLREGDLFIAFGTQLEETALMGWKDIADQHVLIHIDRDYTSLRKSVEEDVSILGDVSIVVQDLLLYEAKGEWKRHEWLEKQKSVKDQLINKWTNADFSEQPVRATFQMISETVEEHDILVQDNGLHDMWGYSYPIFINQSGRTLVPGEQTALGVPMGAGIGAKLAQPDSTIMTFIGDGSFEMGKGALDTAYELGIGMIYLIINNGGYAWPRLNQQKMKVSIGCDFREDHQWRHEIQSLQGAFFSPTNKTDLKNAICAARALSKQGKLSLIEICTDWKKDIPYTVQQEYGVVVDDETPKQSQCWS